jgi:hypothetical protein
LISRAQDVVQNTFPSFGSFSSSILVIDDSGLDGELRVIVKKLSKRDSITKQRALEELKGYLQRNNESIKDFIVVWDKLFNKLGTDHDRKVRENCFGVLDVIISFDSKSLAPILKNISGTWFLSRFDSSKEVCNNSIQSFEKAFPNKLKQVLLHCHCEILDFVIKLILEEKPETMSDKRFVSQEEMNSKYVTCVSAGFDLVGFMLEHIDKKDRKRTEKYQKMFVKPFWAMAYHQDGIIRSGFYRFMKSACLHAVDILEDHIDLVSTQYLSKVFDDQNPSTHTFLWESVLLTTKHIPSLWTQESKKPPLFKLLNFLKKGAYGSFSISYPCLLPLLGNLPPAIITKQFQNEFFESFWKGRIDIDRNGATLFFNSYFECCLFFLKTPGFEHKSIVTVDLIRPLESLLEKRQDRFVSLEIVKVIIQWILDTFEIEQIKYLIPEFQNVLTDLIRKEGDHFWVVEGYKQAKERDIDNHFWTRAVQTYTSKLMDHQIDLPALISILSLKDLELSSELIEICLDTLFGIDITQELVMKAILICISKSNTELKKNYWKMVVDHTISLQDSIVKVGLLLEIVKTISEHPSAHFAPILGIDTFVLEQMDVDITIEGLADLVVELLVLPAPLLLNTSFVESVMSLIHTAFGRYNSSVLIINNHDLHVVAPDVIDNVQFALQVLLKGSSKQNNSKIQHMIDQNMFLLLLLLHASPTTVAVLHWTESSSTGIESAIEHTQEMASNLFKNISTVSQDFVAEWGHEFVKYYGYLNHVGGPADFIEIAAHLLEKVTLIESKKMFVEVVLQSPDMYAQFYQQFNTESYITSIVEPISIWSSSLPSRNIDLAYDHDGLSDYSRWMLLLISFAKSPQTSLWIDVGLYCEITKFVIACEDHLHTSTNLFQSDLLSHTAFIQQDWATLILQMDIHDFWALLEQPNTIFGQSFENLTVSNSVIDARVTRKLIQLVIENVGVTNQAIQQILKLYNEKQYVRCLTLLEPIAPICDVDFLDQLHPVLLKPVLKMKRHSVIDYQNDDGISQLVIYAQFLCAIKFINSEMDPGERNSLVRWVRTLYDALITSKEEQVKETDTLILFDSHVVLIVDYIIKQAIHEHADYGLNMTRFLCDLTQYWFQKLKTLDLNEYGKVFLYHLLTLWETLHEAQTASNLWKRVSDIEEDINKIIVDLFFIIGAPLESTVIAEQRLQEKIAGVVADLDFDEHIRQYTSNEPAIFEMLYTNCEHIQKVAFSILSSIANRRVQEYSLSLEMSLKKKKYGFHSSLLQLLSKKSPKSLYEFFGNGLVWLLIFTHFEGASFDLRQMYTNELKSKKCIGMFLETVLNTLNIGTKKPTINISKWEFNEYVVDGFDGNIEESFHILFAHLYFRALCSVPSLVRSWFSDCTSRQLILSIESFTENYISPLLISKEFQKVQTQSDDDMVIRINTSQIEITASYKIEDAGLDIVIKLPKSYPLKLAEVVSGTYGGRQAGIEETRWRSWLLSVSSVMIGQNGSISDALVLFKKNVSLHFEGLEDCAICYSIISATDRSTPQKKCRVCKHIFHGSCVYKVSFL